MVRSRRAREFDGRFISRTMREANKLTAIKVSKLTRPGRYGGWGGIRTLETLARLPVFKTGAFNHSATHPLKKNQIVSFHPVGNEP
jgi:hypothetical protein